MLNAIIPRHVAASFRTCNDIVCAKCVRCRRQGNRNQGGTQVLECAEDVAGGSIDSRIQLLREIFLKFHFLECLYSNESRRFTCGIPMRSLWTPVVTEDQRRISVWQRVDAFSLVSGVAAVGSLGS